MESVLELKGVFIFTLFILSALSAVLLRWTAKSIFAGILACVFAAGMGAFAFATRIEDMPHLGENARITGVVTSADYYAGYNRYILKDAVSATQSESNLLPGGVYFYSQSTFQYADIVTLTGYLKSLDEGSGEDAVSRRLYYLSLGVGAKVDGITSVECTGTANMGLAGLFHSSRKFLAAKMDEIFAADVSPIAKAMLLGDRSDMDTRTRDAFNTAGISHITVVSGLHVGIIAAAVLFILGLFGLRPRVKFAVTIGFLILFLFLIGVPYSALRALVMITVYLAFTLFSKRTDGLIALCAAFLAVVIIFPLSIFQTSFALSFGSVYGIITLGDTLARAVKGGKAARALCASAGASAGSGIFAANIAGSVCIASIPLNVVVIPLASAALICCFVSLLLGLIYVPLAYPSMVAAAVLLRIIVSFAEIVAGTSFLHVSVPTINIVFAIFAGMILFTLSKYFTLEKKPKIVVNIVFNCNIFVIGYNGLCVSFRYGISFLWTAKISA